MTIPSEWRPLSQRYDEPAEEELYDGIPNHLHGPLIGWVDNHATPEIAKKIALRLRIDLRTVEILAEPHEVNALIRKTASQPDLFLDVIDLILFVDHDDNYYHPSVVEELDHILTLGGSLWRVADDQRSLEQRVNQTARDAATTLINQETNSSSHLAAAWRLCYGRHPNPSRAYSESIKAVEAAAIPIVSPRNSKATLGTVLSDLEASQTHWQLAIKGSSGAGNIAPLLAMLRLLWQGQSDRHGGIAPTIPPSQAAAEAAVHLAVTLTQWFQSGAVARIA